MMANPGVMSIELVELIMKKVSESACNNFVFSLHGGEPLTRDLEYFENIFRLERSYLREKKVHNSIQTNGILIDENFISFFKRSNENGEILNLGVSIDGPREVHDHFRKFRNGKDSHNIIMKNLELLSDNNIKFDILSVCSDIALENISMLYPFYKSLRDLAFLDLLVPHYFKNNLVVSKNHLSEIYIYLFDNWFNDVDCRFNIRFFSSVISSLLGYKNTICELNNNCIANSSILSIGIEGNISFCDCFQQIKLGNMGRFTLV